MHAQAARNYHAMLAARALGRLGGLLGGLLVTPACTAAQQALSALLTPSLAGRLADPNPQQLLRDLNGSVCTPQVCLLSVLQAFKCRVSCCLDSRLPHISLQVGRLTTPRVGFCQIRAAIYQGFAPSYSLGNKKA